MNQLYVICFDISNEKRLRKVAIQMENAGQRIQYSMFECYLNHTQLNELQARINAIINPVEDHIRYYPLCQKDYQKIQISGSGEVTPNSDYYLL